MLEGDSLSLCEFYRGTCWGRATRTYGKLETAVHLICSSKVGCGGYGRHAPALYCRQTEVTSFENVLRWYAVSWRLPSFDSAMMRALLVLQVIDVAKYLVADRSRCHIADHAPKGNHALQLEWRACTCKHVSNESTDIYLVSCTVCKRSSPSALDIS